MKIKIYIFLILISIYGLDVFAEKADTSNLSLPVDTVYVQAIQYDIATYQQFKKDKIYDYYNSKPGGYSLWDMILEKINHFINKQLASNSTNWIIVVVVAVILFLIFYYFRPSWFFVNKKNKYDFSIENENIHELDFERLIKEALQTEQYAHAIRWNYLQLLKALQSKELISWDVHKTVIEYVYELKRSDVKSSFKDATQQFLYYRYGNFDASQGDWDKFNLLTTNIMKQI